MDFDQKRQVKRDGNDPMIREEAMDQEVASKQITFDEKKLNTFFQQQFETKDPTIHDQIEPIHPQVDFYYNSFNIVLGKQGCGKTTLMMKEIMKLSQVPGSLYNLIIYVASSDDDLTFKQFKNYIKIPIVYSTYEDIDAKFAKFIETRSDNNSHTFIIFEDSSFVFRKESSPWNKWICKLRHLRCTIWANLHMWRSINTLLKSQVTTLFVYPGFSKEQMQQVYRQSCIDKDFNVFYGIYQMCRGHDCIKINDVTQEIEWMKE